MAQLRTENYELKASQRDYNVLRSEVASLQHKIHLLEAEKDALGKDYEKREAVRHQAFTELEHQIQLLINTKEQRSIQAKKLTQEMENLRQILEEKNLDIEKYRKELIDYEKHGVSLSKSKEQLMIEVKQMRNKKEELRAKVEQFLEENNRLINSQDQASLDLKDQQQQLLSISTNYSECEQQLNFLKEKVKTISQQVLLYQHNIED